MNLHLVIKRHHQYSADVDQILHIVLVLGRTSCSAVQPIVEPTVWAQQQTVATGEHRLTELKLIEGIRRLAEPIQSVDGVVDDILVILNAMIHSVWS